MIGLLLVPGTWKQSQRISKVCMTWDFNYTIFFLVFHFCAIYSHLWWNGSRPYVKIFFSVFNCFEINESCWTVNTEQVIKRNSSEIDGTFNWIKYLSSNGSFAENVTRHYIIKASQTNGSHNCTIFQQCAIIREEKKSIFHFSAIVYSRDRLCKKFQKHLTDGSWKLTLN